MIIKLNICVDKKVILRKFLLKKTNESIILELLDNNSPIINILIFNQFNGLNYVPISLPLKMSIIDNYIFNPYIILSSYNIKKNNDLDFFYSLETLINSNFNLTFINFNNLKLNIFGNIINKNYCDILNIEFDNINDFKSKLWFHINMNKFYIQYIINNFNNLSNAKIKGIINKYKIPKKILLLSNQFKSIKYPLISTNIEHSLVLQKYLEHDFTKSLELCDIRPDTYYYILINNLSVCELSESITNNKYIDKIVKIRVNKINENIIELSDNKNIFFEKYKWYYFHPNSLINKDYVNYQTYINKNFTIQIIKNILSVDIIHANKIYEYYNDENKTSNLISLQYIYNHTQEYLNDIQLLKTNSYSNNFLEYITDKYSSQENKIYEILEILFSHYTYPLKYNKHEIDIVFDHIIYFSLYNYKKIFINTKTNDLSSFVSEILHPTINHIIPIKVKMLYNNLLKALNQIINNNFEMITFNNKFYTDSLHKNLIKIFCSQNYYLSVYLFKKLSSSINFNKFKNIISTNLLLIDITNKLSWYNLPKKLNYLNLFYKNNNIIYYQDKINKNIIPDGYDIRIKKIIENPFEMYRYLRKQKDFEKWTKFISDKIIQLYVYPISLSSDDLQHIGQIIYLLFDIKEQDIKEPSYITFINFCSNHNKLILESNRINIKIRDFFPYLKTNINLGFLAKHLILNKESISFDIDNTEANVEIIELKSHLHTITKKYYKYKAKYLGTKNNNNQNYIQSDTSSFIK